MASVIWVVTAVRLTVPEDSRVRDCSRLPMSVGAVGVAPRSSICSCRHLIAGKARTRKLGPVPENT